MAENINNEGSASGSGSGSGNGNGGFWSAATTQSTAATTLATAATTQATSGSGSGSGSGNGNGGFWSAATTQSTSATAATTIGGGNPSLSSTVATVATAATTIAAAGPAGTVTFTSDNYSTATCIMTPSNTVYAPMNLGTITFPFTFNPQMINGLNANGQGVSFSLPQGEIEGSFIFTTQDCVFTKTVVRPATAATAATTQATNATAATTLATPATTLATLATTLATPATTQITSGSGSGSGGGVGEQSPTAATTLATAATTLATAATTQATLATNATASPIATTLAPEVAYLNIEDNVEGNINVIENGYGVTFTINTTGVREGTLINFVFTGNLIMDEDFVRMEYIDGPLQVRVGPSGTAEVKAELNRNIEGYRNETLGIELKTPDEDGNNTRRLSHSVTINAHDNGTAATAATTLATAATTLATPATTLATPATTQTTSGSGSGGGVGETLATTLATAATAATTLATPATTLATAATTQATSGSGSGSGSGGGEAQQSPTAATTLATNATAATTQAAPDQNFTFRKCGELEGGGPEVIIIEGQQWLETYGSLPISGDALEHRETRECYDYLGGTVDSASSDVREYTLNGCTCEGGGKEV